MQHRMGKGDLLDAQGRLIERGWASEEARRYKRSAIKAGPLKIKEWNDSGLFGTFRQIWRARRNHLKIHENFIDRIRRGSLSSATV